MEVVASVGIEPTTEAFASGRFRVTCSRPLSYEATSEMRGPSREEPCKSMKRYFARDWSKLQVFLRLFATKGGGFHLPDLHRPRASDEGDRVGGRLILGFLLYLNTESNRRQVETRCVEKLER